MDLVKRIKHLKGINADIWVAIYALLEQKDHFPTMVKVKSHATTIQVITLCNTIAMLALSELADTAADISTDRQGNRKEEVDANVAAEKQLEVICHRIAHIQVSSWRDANKPRISATDVKIREQ